MDPLDPIEALEKRTFSFLEQFKNFAFKGNMIDLAVAVVIGGAFGKLIDSLVKNILMPLISLVIPGEQAYVNWKFAVGAKEIPYGLFLGEFANFLIVGFAVFIFIVKFLGWMTRSRRVETVKLPVLTKDQELLTEIRDLLKQQPQGPRVA